MAFNPDLVALGSLAVPGIVWLVRLEGRINAHDRELRLLEENHRSAFEQLRSDVAYIRDRIDRALGAR